jgi:uncharacterized DUF497 family protein
MVIIVKEVIVALNFEWDHEKSDKNILKHDVSFDEAISIFDDPMYITFLDDEHSIDEERYITIGLSNRGRLLLVAHAEGDDRIRIISARKTTKNEEKFYEEAR